MQVEEERKYEEYIYSSVAAKTAANEILNINRVENDEELLRPLDKNPDVHPAFGARENDSDIDMTFFTKSYKCPIEGFPVYISEMARLEKIPLLIRPPPVQTNTEIGKNMIQNIQNKINEEKMKNEEMTNEDIENANKTIVQYIRNVYVEHVNIALEKFKMAHSEMIDIVAPLPVDKIWEEIVTST